MPWGAEPTTAMEVGTGGCSLCGKSREEEVRAQCGQGVCVVTREKVGVWEGPWAVSSQPTNRPANQHKRARTSEGFQHTSECEVPLYYYSVMYALAFHLSANHGSVFCFRSNCTQKPGSHWSRGAAVEPLWSHRGWCWSLLGLGWRWPRFNRVRKTFFFCSPESR